MSTLMSYPWIAIVVGAAFLGAWHFRRARSAAITGVLWLLYGAYEFLIYIRVLCSGECNIRVDLLMIYPLLLLASLVALWNTARTQRPNSPA